MVTIVIAYESGTNEMLQICLSSLKRYTQVEHQIIVVGNDVLDTQLPDDVEYRHIPLDEIKSQNRVHGQLLDIVIPTIETEYVLTLDSDCFPIADGWLNDLLAMNKDCTGILHPWAPPPEDIEKNRLEFRIRSQHCWNTTHVACQLMSNNFLRKHNLRFNDGDDTGLTIPIKVKELGLEVDGFKVTRCPKPQTDMDPEFNRHVCLVFGDKIYHHGGHSRVSANGEPEVFAKDLEWARERLLQDKGAEFLLDDKNSYQFKFDNEEAVAKDKIDRIFGFKTK